MTICGGGLGRVIKGVKNEKYIKSQSAKPNPKICFIPTATGDDQGYIDNFYKAFNELGCETSHINLSRMLSLAVVDYLKAQLADRKGEIDRKEYYMREFWKKVGDNESNKRKTSMSFPSSPHAVR